MKTIVAGSRSITNPDQVAQAIESCSWTIDEIVSGGARGVDSLAIDYALLHGIPSMAFAAAWGTGRDAGYIRNMKMARYAQALVAVWDGKSKGTKHMIDTMKAMGKPVHIIIQSNENDLFSPQKAKVKNG